MQRTALPLPTALTSSLRRRLAVAAAMAADAGLLVGIVLPRGPVTSFGALVLVVLGLAVGWAAGRFTRSRWALAVAPAAYIAAFELVTIPSDGLTVDGIHLGSTWGVVAVIIGRGFHGLVVLFPMLVGAALGAAYARHVVGPPVQRGLRGKIGLGLRRLVTAFALVGIAVLVVALARPASTPALVGPTGKPIAGSVAELKKVRIADADLWLSIRGASPDLPVLLYLPGGPGQSDLGLSRALLGELTRDFLVVTVDARGIGKAYPSFDPDAATPERHVADTIAVTDYLRERFDEQKIFLFGESGGSVTGVLAVQQSPERFHAWLGSGQMVDLRETDRRIYRDLLADFERDGDQGPADKLRSFGAPPYASVLQYAWVMNSYDRLAGDYDPPAAYTRRAEESGVGFLGLGASEYTLVDKVNAARGLMDTFGAAYPRWQTIDFRRTVQKLDVPVYIFTGDHELPARRDLAIEWFEALDAPHKHLYSYPDAGHATAFEHADDFQRILRDTAMKESGYR